MGSVTIRSKPVMDKEVCCVLRIFYVRLELAKKTWRLICQLLVCKF